MRRTWLARVKRVDDLTSLFMEYGCSSSKTVTRDKYHVIIYKTSVRRRTYTDIVLRYDRRANTQQTRISETSLNQRQELSLQCSPYPANLPVSLGR